ncbi:MAG: acetolactate synthase small subunit [Rickettsiales bacterium]|jgi:acetolactate synthase small subunit|nr:acetolactate synthase small subunit [Rickettsiales bacterium]
MSEKSERSLVTVLVPNIKGQLALISTFFAEHGINILRLTLSAADEKNKIQKIIAYLEGDKAEVEKVCEELLGQETVLKLVNFKTNSGYVEKELCLIKILAENSKFANVMNLITDFGGRIAFSNENTTIFALEDSEEHINDFVNRAVKITKQIELSRSGMVAMSTDEYIDDLINTNL